MESIDTSTIDFGDTEKWEDVTHTTFNIPDILREK